MAADEDDILLDGVLQELELLTPGVKVGPLTFPFSSHLPFIPPLPSPSRPHPLS